MWKFPWQLHTGRKDQDIQESLFLPLHLSLSLFSSHYFQCWRPIHGPHVHWASTPVLSSGNFGRKMLRLCLLSVDH